MAGSNRLRVTESAEGATLEIHRDGAVTAVPLSTEGAARLGRRLLEMAGESAPSSAAKPQRGKWTRVAVQVAEREVMGRNGLTIGLRATCSECGRTAEAAGTGEKSEGRCMAELRKQCDRPGKRFYRRRAEDGGEATDSA
jgi:hypothetical protein